MAPNNTTGTSGMGDSASIQNDYLVLKPILGAKNWAAIESMSDPNAFLRSWVESVPILVGVALGHTNEVRFEGDPSRNTLKAKTGVGASR